MTDVLENLRAAIDEEAWSVSTKHARAVQQVFTTVARLINDGQLVEAIELCDLAGDAHGSLVSSFSLPDDLGGAA